ncbi:TPA: hypothetical protein IQB41_002942 [Listeria monocytogenes]|nr:hypothetical protein [Listeria monocytogenes]
MSIDDVSIHSINAATEHSRQKITEAIKRATEKVLQKRLDEMTDVWLKELLFPELTLVAKEHVLSDFDYAHKKLAKLEISLSLLHSEYKSTYRLDK